MPPPASPAMSSRRLVCRERSIVRGDGGRFTTPPPSRLEARSRLGDKAANELGAPAVSSIPARLPGPEPASARKGREDDRAVLRWNRRVAGPARRVAAAAGHKVLGRQRRGRLERALRAARLRDSPVAAIGLEPSGGYERGAIR